MDLAEIETLAAVARLGSISAAAKAAGVSVSTAARRLDALEAKLRLRLVERLSSGARLTPAGLRLAAMAQPLAEQLAGIARAAEQLREAPASIVRVSATESVIADILAPALPALWARAPGVAVQLQSEAAVISLAQRDADVAVRMTRPDGAALLIRKLPPFELGLFASPAWLAGRDPAAVAVAEGPILAYDDSYGRLPEMAWLARLAPPEAVRLRTGSTRAIIAATRAGAGIGFIARRHAAGLVEIPVPDPPPARTPWLTIHRDLRRLPHIAAVHRWVVAAFAS